MIPAIHHSLIFIVVPPFLYLDFVDITEAYEVQAMPTFLFLRSGQVVDRFSGASVEKLKETIQAHM
jgi:hypothetical protein